MIVAANLLMAGCAGGPPTASGCASSAAQAVRSHVAVSGIPGPCRGLGPAELDQAIRIAVSELAGHGNKAMQRHLGGLARAHLGFLIIPAQRAAAQRVATERAAAMRAAAHRAAVGGTASDVGPPGTRIPVRLAALAAWLLTAGSGGVLLANWLAPGRRRHAAGSPGQFRGSPGRLAGWFSAISGWPSAVLAF